MNQKKKKKLNNLAYLSLAAEEEEKSLKSSVTPLTANFNIFGVLLSGATEQHRTP